MQSEEKDGSPPSDLYLHKVDPRLVDPAELRPYLGGFYVKAELDAIVDLGSRLLPLPELPRTIAFEADVGPPAAYRSKACGPFEGYIPKEELAANESYHFRYAAHKGQTKLCLVEMAAFTKIVGLCPAVRFVVYAGAAPGSHIPFLAESFPRLEFHLYDPAAFSIRNARRTIKMYRTLFTDRIAESWGARGNEVILVSDIRSGDHHQAGYEAEVGENMRTQKEWWRLMKPAAALFKFRLPYTDGLVEPKCPYLDGELLLQPFAPNVSTEGRLLVLGEAPEREYDARAYEDYFHWHNTVVREWASFDHGLELGLVPGLCRCFDCTLAVQTLREYVASTQPERPLAQDSLVVGLLAKLAAVTKQSLLSPPHGVHADQLQSAKRMDLARAYSETYARRRKSKHKTRAASKPAAPSVVQKMAPRPDPDFSDEAKKFVKRLERGEF